MIVLHQAGREWLSPTLLRALSGRQRRAIARRDTHKFESRYLDWLNLECGIIQTEGVKKVEDPIYKIEIYLTLDDRRNPTGLTVTHVSVSGKRYIRDEQYTKSILTNTPGKTEYFWSGTMAKNKNYTMKGTLVRTADNKWYYTEQQFSKGKQTFALRSACHSVEYGD